MEETISESEESPLISKSDAESRICDLLRAQGFEPVVEHDEGYSIIRFSLRDHTLGSVTIPPDVFSLREDQAAEFLTAKVLEASRAAVKSPAAMEGYAT